MSKNGALIAFSAVAVGLGVPALSLYFSVYHGLNAVIAAIVAIFAIISGGVLGILGVVIGPLGQSDDGISASERQRLSQMRAHQRATLEELDDVVEVLEEIRDVLKAVEG